MEVQPTNESAPDPADTARQIIDAMLVRDPVPAVGFAVHKRRDGRPLVTIAVAIGEHAGGALRDAARALAKTHADAGVEELSQSPLRTPAPDSPPQP